MLNVSIRRTLGNFALDICFVGPAGGVTVLFGPSGAGKSATLAAIVGAARDAVGVIKLGERVLIDSAERRFVPPQHRRIGWVSQNARLFSHMPVRANLAYGLRRAPRPAAIEWRDVVDVLAIAPLLDRRVSTLSGGERHRVALGRALLSQPELLLLDEPLAALDDARKGEILSYISLLKARFRLPMVYVTHSAEEALAIGDHVVLVDAGRVSAQGAPRDMLGARATVAARVIAADLAADTVTIALGAQHLTLPGAHLGSGGTVTLTLQPHPDIGRDAEPEPNLPKDQSGIRPA